MTYQQADHTKFSRFAGCLQNPCLIAASRKDTEFCLYDRLSFIRFVGLSLEESVPDQAAACEQQLLQNLRTWNSRLPDNDPRLSVFALADAGKLLMGGFAAPRLGFHFRQHKGFRRKPPPIREGA
jgi:hypothetical protein